MSEIKHIDNGYYGTMIARLAADWHLQRILEIDDFEYRVTNPFTKRKNGTYAVRSNDGRARMDCSTFVSLLLRGIRYKNSMYSKHVNASATWRPSRELENYLGSEGYEFPEIDRQDPGIFMDLGISGYSSLRYAADFAYFFMEHGEVIFDRKIDGECTSDLYKRLQPGDILFWSKSDASPNQKARFRGVSHIALVGEDVRHFFEVTRVEGAILWSSFEKRYEEMELIIRPDYQHKSPMKEIPVRYNLLHYPWIWGAVAESSYQHIEYYVIPKNRQGDCGLWIRGQTGNEGSVRFLKGKDDYNTIHLTPGKYKLSGIRRKPFRSTEISLRLFHKNGSEINDGVCAYEGTDCVFVIEKDCDVSVQVWMEPDSDINCRIYPRLEKMAN